MMETRNISPEEIFAGETEYSEEQFKNDLIELNNETLTSTGNIDSLTSMIDEILQDIKTNNEPDDFLTQFHQVNYKNFMLDDEECNVALIGYKYLNTASFTYYLYMIYASVLKERYQNGLLSNSEFNKIKEKYFSSFEEFNLEREVHKKLMDMVAID